MHRIRKKIASWEEGKKVMNKISENLKLEIVESEEYLRCKDDNIEVSCHLNPEGYAFILAKSTDKNQIANIEEILQL